MMTKVDTVKQSGDLDVVKSTDKTYLLNEVKAMKKKLEYTDRKVGLEVAGGSVDKQSIKLSVDTATYEFLRKNIKC